jgi:hypothetical protein
MIHTNLMHRQRSRRGTKIPHNAAIDALLVKITETELAIQDLEAAIDGDGNGAGQLSAPQHKQASKHLLNRQRKIISHCQQLDKLPSVLRSGKWQVEHKLELEDRATPAQAPASYDADSTKIYTRHHVRH